MQRFFFFKRPCLSKMW